MHTSHDLTPQRVAITDLIPHPLNARTHDIDTIASSLQMHGQFAPVVRQRSTGYTIKGHGTVEAAVLIGMRELDVITLDVDDDQAKRILLIDNRSSDKGGYHEAGLAELLSSMDTLDATGYTPDDLTVLLARLDAGKPDEPASGADRDEVPTAAPPLTRRGDVWLLGPHRLMCGDCRSSSDVDRLLDDARINVAVTSPPYAEQREYDEASGFRPIPPDEYVAWFDAVQFNVAAHLADDGSWFVNIKPPGQGLDTHLYVFDLVIAHVRQWGWHFGTEFCWERTGVPKQVVLRFKNQFEPVYQFTRARWKMRADNVRHLSDNAVKAFGPGRGNTSWADPNSNVVSQGQSGDMFAGQRPARGKGTTGRASGGVTIGLSEDVGLAYPGNRLPTFNSTHTATGHAAAFPVGLPAWFIRAYTDRGDNVFDPFAGSGSTLLAAHDEGRVGFGMELSPVYCDIICKRFQTLTGIVPVDESTSESRSFITPKEQP